MHAPFPDLPNPDEVLSSVLREVRHGYDLIRTLSCVAHRGSYRAASADLDLHDGTAVRKQLLRLQSATRLALVRTDGSALTLTPTGKALVAAIHARFPDLNADT